jgi:enoyl-CoA hydratase
MATAHQLTLDTISLERDGHVLVIGLNRPDKRNSFNVAMLAGVLFAHGDHFTAGRDLVDVGPNIVAGQIPFPEDGRDPWRLDGPWTKPMVAAEGVQSFIERRPARFNGR